MKLKRLALVAAVGGLTLPTYWQAASATHPDHECADGLDNDQNGATDLADSGCIDGDDDDESGGRARPSGGSASSSSATNSNNNTSANSNDNSSSSTSGSTSSSQSSSSSSLCLVLCGHSTSLLGL